jgi:hypothetical protein
VLLLDLGERGGGHGGSRLVGTFSEVEVTAV